MEVYDKTLITSKPDKGGAIWKIGTNKGNRSLKVLHRTPQRSLYSIGAQDYLVNAGARVPALIPTKDGNLYVEAGDKSWIVTEWVEPMVPVSKIDLEGAIALCYGLGEFHRHSKGYVPPYGASKSSRLFRWPKYYEKIIAKIGWFRDIAKLYSHMPSSANLLSAVELFEKQARDIASRFHDSPYSRMIAEGEPFWGLVHQDYGWSNGQMGPEGIWVIDLDGVAYDLPIRDLRKLITSTMDDRGVWDTTWIRGMIEAYHHANPIDQETFEILWLDMAFPNEFYKHVKEIVFDPQTFMQNQLDPILARVTATESSKWAALSDLEEDKWNYKSGNYTKELSDVPFSFPLSDALPGDKLIVPPLILPDPGQPTQPVTAPVIADPPRAPQKAPATVIPLPRAGDKIFMRIPKKRSKRKKRSSKAVSRRKTRSGLRIVGSSKKTRLRIVRSSKKTRLRIVRSSKKTRLKKTSEASFKLRKRKLVKKAARLTKKRPLGLRKKTA
ncbi:CotS family spore coat protein [Paenibacillus piri]|uniref:CotS family spore coat protein n=2 Tax=Paenibacillus piri TaxID=2547395 RepID=A0A4R5KBN8_9BACL|nr:CotS family spore coat protein [Paenibacillus piri]